MPVVPRKGPHPFAKPLVIVGVKRPRSSVLATAPCLTDTSAHDLDPANTLPDPTDTTQSPSWLDGPYGPAAEARQEEFAELVGSGLVTLDSLRTAIEARKENPKADESS